MTTLQLPLNPLLVDLNSRINNAGIQKGNELWFYTSPVAYKVWIYDWKFFVTRVSNKYLPCQPAEWIPLLESGDEHETLAILNQEPFFLTPEQVAVQWAKFGKDIELRNVSAG